MPLTLLIPLVIFLVLLVVIALILRRISLLVAESRRAAGFQSSVAELSGRIDATLASVITRIDALRRQQIEVEDVSMPLHQALESLEAYATEVRSLDGPPAIEAPKAALVAELDRADRALQMVAHGCDILVSMHRGERYGEAQTAIKRGYLNVLHSREALQRHAADIALSRTPEEPRWFSGSTDRRD